MASETLGQVRKKTNPFLFWAGKYAPWLIDIHSLFYFFVFVFFLGIAWAGYSLWSHSFTTLYNWDYSSQYVTFYYNFWDSWRNFLKTGQFEFYSTGTFLGTDAIGSNSYYGLFDPFFVVMVIFPRLWIPQMVAIMTFVKGACGALAMRAYLRYMGLKEGTSRLGGTVFAFSGFVNYFVGFPSFVSMTVTVPLILLGIEKVIKERKPSYLIWGVALLGVISFFFLVVICIFSVLYAIWRYLWTIRQRSAKDNGFVILMGVTAFAVGIMLCAWTLLPSIREASLSGRGVSIGHAYLDKIIAAFKDKDFSNVIYLLTQNVGDNPGRELMGLMSFFYPTTGYQYLPLAAPNDVSHFYDSWTSSLFCYTPMVILFFCALLDSIRRKKWSHLIAIALCLYLLFTTFAYYFFYAFTGDGYGRWFIVLIPLIIYYGCSYLDRIKENPNWELLGGTIFSCLMTVLTFFIVRQVLYDKTFSSDVEFQYWLSAYALADNDGLYGISGRMAIVYYQIILVFLESIVILALHRKEYLWKVLIGFVSIETIVSGNLSFFYCSSLSYTNDFNGGAAYVAAATEVSGNISDHDSNYYRVYSDSSQSSGPNVQMDYGYNGTGTFHSLLNFDLADFARMSHIMYHSSSYSAYGEEIQGKSWSGYYGNKRLALDTTLGMKYYVIQNEGYPVWGNDNVPFGCVLRNDLSNETFRVYENTNYIELGHAVGDTYYKIGHSTDNEYLNSFYVGNGSYGEIIRNEEVFTDSAIFEDVDSVPAEFTKASSIPSISSVQMSSVSYLAKGCTTTDAYGGFHDKNPGLFLTDSSVVDSTTGWTSFPNDYVRDDGKVVLYPSTGWGNYFNSSDQTGAYFLLSYPSRDSTRIYMIGDTFNDDGTVAETNVMLNYEYNSIAKSQTDTYRGLFGFYAKGKVKYIVYCSKGGAGTIQMQYPSLWMMNRSDVETKLSMFKSGDYALSNVKYSTDKFTFDTDYSTDKIVVTQLGYDAGWKVKAKASDGTVSELSVYKVDGGLVGFIAPAGAISYELYYETPYFETGMIAATAGLGIYIAFELLVFALEVSKIKKSGKLDASLPRDDKKGAGNGKSGKTSTPISG